MNFDAFDIAEAYDCLERDWNTGGWIPQRTGPSQRRRRSIGVQLHRLRYRPRDDLSYETLTENGQEIYRAACVRWGLSPAPEMSHADD